LVVALSGGCNLAWRWLQFSTTLALPLTGSHKIFKTFQFKINT
jgi:hypothetical protein